MNESINQELFNQQLAVALETIKDLKSGLNTTKVEFTKAQESGDAQYVHASKHGEQGLELAIFPNIEHVNYWAIDTLTNRQNFTENEVLCDDFFATRDINKAFDRVNEKINKYPNMLAKAYTEKTAEVYKKGLDFDIQQATSIVQQFGDRYHAITEYVAERCDADFNNSLHTQPDYWFKVQPEMLQLIGVWHDFFLFAMPVVYDTKQGLRFASIDGMGVIRTYGNNIFGLNKLKYSVVSQIRNQVGLKSINKMIAEYMMCLPGHVISALNTRYLITEVDVEKRMVTTSQVNQKNQPISEPYYFILKPNGSASSKGFLETFYSTTEPTYDVIFADSDKIIEQLENRPNLDELDATMLEYEFRF